MRAQSVDITKIKAIVGLGNPGPRFTLTPHNAGFLVLDDVADRCMAHWQQKGDLLHTTVSIPVPDDGQHSLILVKPQTFMNTSGKVLSFLLKKGIKPNEILVVHDELEKQPGYIASKIGGSARGHNGLRSIISVIGMDFWRMRIGIGRPERREDVGDYVLRKLPPEKMDPFLESIQKAVDIILG